MQLPGQQALVLRALAALLAVLALAPVAPAGAQTARLPTQVVAGPADGNAVERVDDLTRKPAGHQRTGAQVLQVAEQLPQVIAERRRTRGSYPNVFLKGKTRWQVSFYSRDKPAVEIAQVLVDDATGVVTEAYTGYKVAWTMARGYDGAFGRKVNSPWVWIPLTILFVAPFVTWSRPFRLLHLDLLVMAGFGLSLMAFNDADIDTSVPIIAPLLAYLLLRMLWVGLRRPDPEAERRPLPLLVPTAWLVVATVFLVGFRVGLNLTSSNVIDVGYAGVVGADRLAHGERLYGAFPKDIEHGDTYGPVGYAAYVPFELVFPWSGRWDDLPAAHAAAIAFDLACLLLLFLVGRRIRGPGLGIVLAYAWAAYPFTIYASNTNSNDALVPALLLVGLLLAERPVRRGAATAIGGLSKMATLAVAPVFATHRAGGVRDVLRFAAGFLVAAAVALLPVWLEGPSLHEVYDRTIGFQAGRDAPFSIWGLYDLDGLQKVWQGIAIGLALLLAVVPRRRDLVGLAALAAAVLIAFQLGATYWFYLYLVWFAPLVWLALFGRFAAPAR
ncbi:hypothetical protein [Conexibacter sp. SYSU D00693]|uniref:hypothetical protein n=1 Tax=Conexibacter sp. SYSU D00693 TaxID=2812560 RepID=UPI00196B556B|nr:hypothetical protein [Conexibacter sp. SYSU D00693]